MFTSDWAQRKTSYDFVVVGSGYGGAITAARIAAADLNPKPSICILERGKERWPGNTRFPDTLDEMTGEFRGPGNPLGLYELADLPRHLRHQGVRPGRHLADQRQCSGHARPGRIRTDGLAAGACAGNTCGRSTTRREARWGRDPTHGHGSFPRCRPWTGGRARSACGRSPSTSPSTSP